MCTDLLCHPIDTMKTRLQANGNNKITFQAIVGKNWRSLFAGASTTGAAFPSCFTYFTVYENIKGRAEIYFGDSPAIVFGHFTASTFAEIASICVR